MKINSIYHGDALNILRSFPDNSIDCCVTSPPYYGLRDYGVDEQIGMEDTLGEYLGNLLNVFSEVKRVLNREGTFWLNIGDGYSGSNQGANRFNKFSKVQSTNIGSISIVKKEHKSKLQKIEGCKPKDLIGVPWKLAFALRDEIGFYLRQDIIWAKLNCMPESVKDRCTKSHEYIFLFAKSRKYYFDSDAIKEKSKSQIRDRYKYEFNTGIKVDGVSNSKGVKPYTGFRNKRDVWIVNSKGFKGLHFATFPPDLIKPCILAGCPKNGIVLDPFFGSGTVGIVAKQLNRNYIGIDINKNYCELAEERIKNGGV